MPIEDGLLFRAQRLFRLCKRLSNDPAFDLVCRVQEGPHSLLPLLIAQLLRCVRKLRRPRRILLFVRRHILPSFLELAPFFHAFSIRTIYTVLLDAFLARATQRAGLLCGRCCGHRGLCLGVYKKVVRCSIGSTPLILSLMGQSKFRISFASVAPQTST